MPARKSREPSARLHAFELDEDQSDLRSDGVWRVQVCACGKPGEPGDLQHPLDAPRFQPRSFPPVPEGDRSAQIIGEGGEQ